MGSAFLVNHLDFARSFQGQPERATPESIAVWLRDNWIRKRGGGVWNYTPAMDVLAPAFAGRITFEQSLSHCREYWHAHGRVENELVVKSYWSYASSNPSRVYGRKFLAAPVGRWKSRNIFIAIKAPLIRVTPDTQLAVMPVFRRTFLPNDAELNICLTAVREFCVREGYRDIDPELICSRAQNGTVDRRLIVERGSQRTLYTSDQFDSFAAKYAGGVALLADAGLGLQEPNFRGYRVWDPDQPPFPP